MRVCLFLGNEIGAGAFSRSMTNSLAYGLAKNDVQVTVLSVSDSEKIRVVKLFDQIVTNPPTIQVVTTDNPLQHFKNFDWVIWNTYRSEHTELLRRIRGPSTRVRVAKLFPRLLTSDDAYNKKQLLQRFSEFDFIGFSLLSDYNKALKYEFPSNCFGYSPRGFVSELLGYRLDLQESFKISIDGLVRPLEVESKDWNPEQRLTVLSNVLRSFVAKYPDTCIVTTRLKFDIPNIKVLKPMILEDFYKEFFINTSVYIASPFSKSRHGKEIGDGYLGSYENQIIESQIAGALTISEINTIAPELLFGQHHFNQINYDDFDQIFSALETHRKAPLNVRFELRKAVFQIHDSVVAYGKLKKLFESH